MDFDAALVVSELVTNALTHLRALGPVRDRRIGLTFRRLPDGVQIEVHDGSDHRPNLSDPADLAETGRGLHIVTALTDGRWGISPRPASPGKVIWAAVRTPPHP